MCDNSLEDALTEYRKVLLAAEQAAQSEFDKAVLTLSSAGLGLSISFLKDVVGIHSSACSWALAWCWASWAVSIISILFSYLTSAQALRKALKDTDAGTIFLTAGNSYWSSATKTLNVLGAIGFASGILFLICFVWRNPVH